MITWKTVKKAWKKAFGAFVPPVSFPVAFKEVFASVSETLLWLFTGIFKQLWKLFH